MTLKVLYKSVFSSRCLDQNTKNVKKSNVKNIETPNMRTLSLKVKLFLLHFCSGVECRHGIKKKL